MISARVRAIALGVVVVAAGCGDSDGDSSRGVAVTEAWARPTPGRTTTSAVYMEIRAEEGDSVIAVSVDPAVAMSAMAHETTSSAGQLSMDHVMGIELPAGDDIRFEPGGLHVMLEGLAEPLVAGDTFELTLDFERADDVIVEVVVSDEAP